MRVVTTIKEAKLLLKPGANTSKETYELLIRLAVKNKAILVSDSKDK